MTYTATCENNKQEHSNRLAFWKWKAAVIQMICTHPALQSDASPRVVPDFDSPEWEHDFTNGMTVDQAFKRAEEVFNRLGW